MRATRVLFVTALVSSAVAAASCGGAAPTPQLGAGAAHPMPSASASATNTAQTPPQPRADASLIKRSVLFRNPDKSSVRVSPDGKQLSYIAPLDGVMNVYVAPIDDLSKAKAVTAEKTRPLRRYWWAETSDK